MFFFRMAGALIAALAVFSGAVSAWAEPRPDVPETSARMIESAVRAGTETPRPEVRTRGVISLEDAVALAFAHHPGLAAAAWTAGAGEAGVRQAGARPNPELEFEAEEFGGTGGRRALEGAEVSARLSQTFELGGKRARRVRAAEADRALSRWEYEILRREVRAGVATTFIELLAARDRASLAGETLLLAERFHAAAEDRVRAGKVPPVEEAKARVALAAERLKRDRADRELVLARKALAAFWGEAEPGFETAAGRLDSLPPTPAPDRPATENPEIQRSLAAAEHRRALLDQERTARIPDLTVTGGAVRFMEDDGSALVMGLSIPLPVFDRNRGNVLRAERELAAAREARRAEEIRVGQDIAARRHDLIVAREEAETLLREVIPAARDILAITEEGYRAGKYSVLEVLDAQRGFFEAREQGIEALAASHTAAAELARLTGETEALPVPRDR